MTVRFLRRPMFPIKYKQILVTSRSQTFTLFLLLRNKKQRNSSELFKALILNPSCITIDFEIPVRNAFKQMSIDVEASFCYFNFCLSLLQNRGNNCGIAS